MGFFTNLLNTGKQIVQTGASDVSNWFTNIGNTALNNVTSNLKSIAPTQEQINANQSPIAKSILSTVAPGVQSFIEGGFSGYSQDAQARQDALVAQRKATATKQLADERAKGTSEAALTEVKRQAQYGDQMGAGEIQNMTMGFMNPTEGIDADIIKIAKSKSWEVISPILEKLGIEKNTADAILPKLVKESTPEGVNQIINDAKTASTMKPGVFKGTEPANPYRTENTPTEAGKPDISQPGTETPGTGLGENVKPSYFNNITDVVKSPEGELVAPPVSRFKTPEELINTVELKGAGLGFQLNKTELGQLLQHLASTDGSDVVNLWGKDIPKGTIYKSYGGGQDVVLGKVTDPRFGGDTAIVAQMKDGKLTGTVRTHGSQIADKDIVGRMGDVSGNEPIKGKIVPNQAVQGPGHVNLSNALDKMIKNNTILPGDANIIKTLLEGTDDALLNDIKFKENANLERPGNFRAKSRNGEVIPGTAVIKLQKGLFEKGFFAATAEPAKAFTHEFGHAGYYMVLNNSERDIVDQVFSELQKSGRIKLFQGGLSGKLPGSAEYYAKDPQELFAESFANYVFENKVPAEQMKPLLERVAAKFYDGLRRLVFRGEESAVERMKPLFEKILKGDKSTPLSEFANKDTPSFKLELQKMFDNFSKPVDPNANGVFVKPQVENTLPKDTYGTNKPVKTVTPTFSQPTKEVPPESIFPSGTVDKGVINPPPETPKFSPANPKNPIEFNITGVTEAERVQSAIRNSERAKNEIITAGQDAHIAGQKLSPADLKLAEGYEHGVPIADLAKKAENPKQFTAFMDKVKKYYDLRLESDMAAGGDTGYVKNYLPHNWDLSNPADLNKFNDIAKQRGIKPYEGFRSQPRVFNSYAEGERLGFKRANSNVLQDLVRDYNGASERISKQVLKQGLSEAVPAKVSLVGHGKTVDGKPFINSNIKGLEGISYHPDVAKQLKGYTGLTNQDVFKLMTEKGFDPKDVSTYSKGWEALREAGVIDSASSVYDHLNPAMKHFMLNLSGFHSINVSLNFAGASIFSHPWMGLKGLAQSVPAFFSEKVTQGIIDGFKSKLVNGQDFSVFDAGLRSGVNMTRGMPVNNSLFHPMSALSRAMFDRELYTLKLNLVDQVFGSGKVLPESVQGGKLAKEINQFMGEMNNHTMNINPNAQKWWSRLLLAPQFTESKYALIGKAVSTNPTKTLALRGVAGKSVVVGTLATMGTLLATGKFPSLKQVLMNYTINPSIQTNLKNPKGVSQDIGLPQTFVSEPSVPIAGLFQGSLDPLIHYGEARLSPVLSDAITAATNKDYYGNPIIDNNSKDSALTQVMKNLGATDLPIGIQALVNFKEGKITAQQAAITIIGLKTHANPDDPTSVHYKQIDDAKNAISKIPGSDPDRVSKIQAIMNSIDVSQRKSVAYQLLLAGVNTKGVYTSETERKYFQVQDLLKQGKGAEANAITKAMTKDEYKTYKTIKTKLAHEATYQKILDLANQGKTAQANYMTHSMTKEQYKAYTDWKAKQ